MSGSKVSSFIRLFKQAIKGDQQDYTTLSIDKAIFLLSIPMVLEMAMESLFAVVDAFFVGRLHDNSAVATIGLTESMLTLIYSVAMGMGMGATAMVARRVGEKDIPSARVAASQVILVGIAVSLVISVVGIFFSEDLLRLMGGSEALIEKNSGYTRWMITGNMSIMMLFLINGIFRGAGDASIAMRSLILANIFNMILDPIFIFGWGPIPAFGVEGAGIATTTGRTIGVVYQVYHLVKGSGIIQLTWKHMKPKWDIIWRLVVVSSGGTGQFLIGSGSWIFLYRIMSSFGEEALAGYVFAMRAIVFAILPAWGMANAAATLVGQNLGAGFPDRAEKSVWRASFLNMIFLAVVTVVFFTMARPILSLFTTDEVVIKHGIECLQIVSLGYIFYAYGMVVGQSFNGAGDTRTPTIVSFVGFWLFQIPFAYLLALYFQVGTIGVYAAISVAESLMAVASILIFRKGKWKATKI
ncbi:MATE family efflux transporter [Chryseolinea lacunae]|uniref:Multidrug-efflux transporter n=1 Tax=Chryseolinea lacunae TaxID=2801331 RepID=A0ABS1KNA1_9BACT|nr:MATE family efflux transporter [Chryseolinea lacunae]MBL0740152.1 MATE family efflux transporter [Chryseolinea lacunae]